MTWQQFLTEKVLHERVLVKKPERCKTCKGLDCYDCADNRTFDNRNDLMDLYEAVWKNGKWDSLEDHLFNLWDDLWGNGKTVLPFSVWRFCLTGSDYEARCKTIAEFYGWEEVK